MKPHFQKIFQFKPLPQPFIIIADKTIQKKFPTFIKKIQDDPQHLGTILVTSGEKLKSSKSFFEIVSKLSKFNCQKDSILLAIGGGTVLDLVGLLANLWMRGITWYAYPTTVLAQVDSCLGGKTAINFKNRKNILGTIYQPSKIFIYHSFVSSLPDELKIEGSSEIFKHALLNNELTMLHELKKMKLSQALIKKSLLIKEKYIAQDLHEKKGLRIKLNLGHTFGHALEQMLPKYFNHGAAVWWGLKMELTLSQLLGAKKLKPWIDVIDNILLSRKTYEVERRIITKNLTQIFSNTKLDKKNTHKSPLTFILLKAPGKSTICHQVPINAMKHMQHSLELMHD